MASVVVSAIQAVFSPLSETPDLDLAVTLIVTGCTGILVVTPPSTLYVFFATKLGNSTPICRPLDWTPEAAPALVHVGGSRNFMG